MHRKTQNLIIKQFTKDELITLRHNHTINKNRHVDPYVTVFPPVLKLINPMGKDMYYLSELSPDNMGFGICINPDIELGYVSLNGLNELRLPLNGRIQKDPHFIANGLSIYELYDSLKQNTTY